MSWKAEYVILIIISTLIDYIAGLQIYKSTTKARKKFFLLMSLFTNLGLLFAFKYFNFFSEATREILSKFAIPLQPITLKVLLPVGISFYTFQTLSYTIDVYRGKIKPQKHLGVFAVYVAFFPQLVAGPIERAKNLLPQFFKEQIFEYKRVTDGLKLMLWGFFKKIVIADTLAIFVDAVYLQPYEYTGLPLILATFFFGFQIYCDFSGYSDVAIGAAQIFGIKLMDNFKRPYFSKSVADFWRRWHISLTTWFRDYIYIPLGGNRISASKTYFNLFFVFLISGLWHGSNWTFILWGVLHGVYLIFSLLTKNIRENIVNIVRLNRLPKIHSLIQVGITFVIVNVTWVFFRAQSITEAIYILTHFLKGIQFDPYVITLGFGIKGALVVFPAIILMEFVHLIQEHISIRQFLDNRPLLLRWTIYMFLIWFILITGVVLSFGTRQFIYFQF